MGSDNGSKSKGVIAHTGPRIILRNVHLQYPVVRDQSSLKAMIFSALGFNIGPKIPPTQVHALRGLDLTINRGERVGFIGHNGAGKSTLLRAIAGIFPISAGRISVTGTVQGLFDLGTGFEAEATGRENITYRGLAIGSSPKRIAERVEEIIAFAELGDFIDFPMRTYSAGMYVRLGFAISTYLEGNILLIDEVYGAGDAKFQMKAQARMRQLIENAGIILIVSHDFGILRNICTRVIWLSEGKIIADGEPSSVLELYSNAMCAA
jgi:lipopolysaccharide transport system ATP-binding protein